MLARCARCQGTFTTDHFGLQTCPHCGAELHLADPNAPAGSAAPQEPVTPSAAPPDAAPQPPPAPPPQPPPVFGTAGAPAGPGAPPPGGPGWGAPPPPPPSPDGSIPSPFAERARRGLVAAFFETWKLVATDPQRFFSRVRIDQTGTAILFGVIAATIGNAAAAVYGYLSSQQALVAFRGVMEKLPEDQARIMRLYEQALSGSFTLAQVVLAPLFTLIGIYVTAAILHLLLLLFRGASRGFDATLTTVAYVNGLNLLLAVPGCGGLLALVWMIVALVIGIAAAHRCGTGRAAAAVLAPAVLVCVCCCGIAGISAPAFLKSLQDAAKETQTTNL